MTTSAQVSFVSATAYGDDIFALPVADISKASEWYSVHFGMTETTRSKDPLPVVILERDGVKIGFAKNGGDPSQDGASILVKNIDGVKRQLESKGVTISNIRVDERDGVKLNVFFVVAPDGLCYYFHEPLAPS